MCRKALVFDDSLVAKQNMEAQLPEDVVEVLFGGLCTAHAQRASAEELYKNIVGGIKALGRKAGSSAHAKKFDSAVWDMCKYDIVLGAVCSKFEDGLCEEKTEAIRDFLKGTAL